jgi:hypothetical protein
MIAQIAVHQNLSAKHGSERDPTRNRTAMSTGQTRLRLAA